MTDPPIRERDVSTEAVPEGLTLAAFNTDCTEADLADLGDALAEYLAIDDVTVGSTVADDRPAEFAVLHDDVFVGGPLVRAGGSDDALADAASAHAPTDTLFLAGYGDNAGLRGLSNRIETQAWRAGAGRLYVGGHQRLASMDDQWELYGGIADEGVEVHVFEEAEYVPTDPGAFVVHGGRHALAGTWLVAFDGDGNDAAKGALVAVERGPDSYFGVWTVVPELVDQILERVAALTAGGRHSGSGSRSGAESKSEFETE